MTIFFFLNRSFISNKLFHYDRVINISISNYDWNCRGLRKIRKMIKKKRNNKENDYLVNKIVINVNP